MTVLGLTGGIGSGKSLVLDIFRETYGAKIIQTDLVAAELETPGHPAFEQLIARFGSDILDEKGDLDRKGFAARIFGNEEALYAVNQILHPAVWEEVCQRVQASKRELVVVESALFDEKSRQLCQYLIYVSADRETRIARLIESRGYSREKCLDIMKNQQDEAHFCKLCDFVLDNNGDVQSTRMQLAEWMKKIKKETYK